MDNSNSYIDLMIDSLGKKITILEEISDMNQIQKALVAEEKFDAEEFDNTVAGKDELIEEINKLDEGFEMIYERVRSVLLEDKDKYADKIASMQECIRRIVELSTTIQADEKRIKAAMDSKFSKIKQAVKETRKNSKAVSNYYKTMSRVDSEPQFMDKKK